MYGVILLQQHLLNRLDFQVYHISKCSTMKLGSLVHTSTFQCQFQCVHVVHQILSLVLLLVVLVPQQSGSLPYSMIPPPGILSVYLENPSRFDAAIFPEFVTNHQPATFNANIKEFGHSIKGRLIAARNSNPSNGCTIDSIPHIPNLNSSTSINWILLVDNLDCDFKTKIVNAAKLGYATVLIYNTNSDHETQIISVDDDSINEDGGVVADSLIYTSSISGMDGYLLASIYAYPAHFYVQIDENPYFFFEILYHLMLICFTITGIFIGLFCATWLYDLFKCEHCMEEFESERQQTALKVLLTNKTLTRSWTSDGPFLNNDACIICLEEFTVADQIRVLPCLHVFHINCVDVWMLKMSMACPICKQTIGSIVEERMNLENPNRNHPTTTTASSSRNHGGGAGERAEEAEGIDANARRRAESYQLLNSTSTASNYSYNSLNTRDGWLFYPMDVIESSLGIGFYSMLNEDEPESRYESEQRQSLQQQQQQRSSSSSNNTLRGQPPTTTTTPPPTEPPTSHSQLRVIRDDTHQERSYFVSEGLDEETS